MNAVLERPTIKSFHNGNNGKGRATLRFMFCKVCKETCLHHFIGQTRADRIGVILDMFLCNHCEASQSRYADGSEVLM